MSVIQLFFFVWRVRIMLEALIGNNGTYTHHQSSIGYSPVSSPNVARLTVHRTLLVLATYMPALLGHLMFASDHQWFWKHILVQFAMGTASTFLPAYTLATLHEVSITAQLSKISHETIAHAGRRLVGGRAGSDMEAEALW